MSQTIGVEPTLLDSSDTVAALRVAGRFYRFFVSGQLMNANAGRSMRKVCGLGGLDINEPAATDSDGQSRSDNQNDCAIATEDEQGDHVGIDNQITRVALPSVSRLKWEAAVNAGAQPFDDAAALMKAYRNSAARRVRSLAQQLPVWPWVSAIRGAGDLNLGLIIGETGDLATYGNPAKLWKRMGLAVMADGRSHRRVKGEMTGYSPIRRTIMHNLGECLLKGNDGEMRALYDARKAYELARAPEMKPIVAHKRSLRYMEKRFLRDLWREWRRVKADQRETSSAVVPDPVSEVVQAEARTDETPTTSLPKPARKTRQRVAMPAETPERFKPSSVVADVQAEAIVALPPARPTPKPAPKKQRRKADKLMPTKRGTLTSAAKSRKKAA